MNKPLLIAATVTASVLLAVGSLMFWLTDDPKLDIKRSEPGMDNAPGKRGLKDEKVVIGEFFKRFEGKPSDLPGQWLRFRGKDFDNICKNGARLADRWKAGEPKVLWKVSLGEGHAAPVINNGRVYLLDYLEEEKSDALRCFSLADGREIWRRWYKVNVKRNHGMSRTVPVVNDKYVVTIGPRCHVMCVRADSGDFLWGLDLERDFGTKVPFWYTGQCALMDNNIAVIAPGGSDVLMMGVDCETGNILWKTPNTKKWDMSHSSIMPMTLNGKKMYVYSAIGGLAGISAEPDDIGTILWSTNKWNKQVLAPSPVVADNGLIYLTAGYGAGSMLIKVSDKEGSYSVEVLASNKPSDALALEQQTAILYQGHLFGIMPKDGGALRRQFVCVKMDKPGEFVWTSGKDKRFGLGPFIIADNKFYILNDNGELTMARLSLNGYEELGKAKIFDGHDAWGPIAIAGTKMLLRDSTQMVCIEIGDE